MKNSLFILVIFSFTLTSCFHDRIDGNGVIEKTERSVDEFNSIYLDGVFDVVIEQRSDHSVVVETDENLQRIVQVETINNRLYVDLKDHVNFDATRMTIHISTPELNKIDSDGVVDIETKGSISVDELKIYKDGVGKLNASIYADKIDVSFNGVGNIYLKGETIDLLIDSDGVGKVDAYDLYSQFADVRNSGVGDSKVNVSESLSVNISGVGSVYYKGNPENISSKVDGVGKLKKY